MFFGPLGSFGLFAAQGSIRAYLDRSRASDGLTLTAMANANCMAKQVMASLLFPVPDSVRVNCRNAMCI